VLGYFIARDWQALAKAMISDRNEAVAVGTKEGVVLNIVQGIANWEYQNSGTRSKRVQSNPGAPVLTAYPTFAVKSVTAG
jgi:hypothetical protein